MAAILGGAWPQEFEASAEQHPASDAPASDAPASDAPEPVDSLYVPEGLEATLWAETPQLYNPTNMDVDSKGRVWVVEAVDYRDFNNPDSTHLSHPQGERVVILEDTDGDGAADTSKTFVQDKDLVSPLGIAVIGNKVVVSASPHMVVYTDEDGDDKPDDKEVLLTGFGGKDHDHGLHAVTAGPDGRWYFNTGNAGPHIVTDQSGWTLRAGSLYNGGTPYMGDNKPGLKSDDGHIWTGGLALRVEPNGKGLDVLAHNFRNPYELAVDSYGNLWTNDNDDQVIACRTLWVMEGANAGYFSPDGSRTWPADRRPGQSTFTAHWHQEDPGVIPAGDNSGAGSPTGITVYEGEALGKEYRGMVFSAEAGRNVIFGYKPEQKGAGYQMKQRSNFISSVPDSTLQKLEEGYQWNDIKESTRQWFRPSDVAVGPDGALYVADWYDPVVGGHQMRDSIGYGRIYRIAPEDTTLHVPALDLSTLEGQIEALKSPAINVRYLGFTRLRERGAAALDAVKALLEAENPYHRARAVWLLAQLGPEGRREAEKLLSAEDPDLRLTAYRALRQVQDTSEMLQHARQLASDASPAVRRDVALSLRGVPLAKSQGIIATLASQYEGSRRWELEAIGLAAEGKEEALYPLLKKRFGAEDPATWSQRFADLAWRLHPKAAISDLEQRAEAPGLSWEVRKQALVALGFINDRRAVDAMDRLAKSNLGDVANRASWWLSYRRTNAWQDLKDWKDANALTAAEQQVNNRMAQLKPRVTNSTLPVERRRQIVREMAENAQGGRMLIGLITKGRLPEEIADATREALRENPDRTVRVLADYYLAPAANSDASDSAASGSWSADDVARLEGSAEQGQALFYANCAVCHRVGETGGKVGPNLTQVKNKFGKTDLINAIVHPNDGIAHGFYPLQVTMQSGGVLFGFLLADNGGSLVLRGDQGQQHVVVADRIAQREQLGASLMPSPAELKLSRQEVADITAFLMSAGTQ